MLVVLKLRARICRASNTKPHQLRRFAGDRLKDRDVASRYYDELESELNQQGVTVQAQPLKLKETIERVATNTIGYTRKQANKEWFDGECAKVNEEGTAGERAIQNKTRGAKNAYKLARTKEKRLIERHRSIQDSRKFYKRLNDVRRPFESNQKLLCVELRTGNY
jgi:hypothetical protein